MRKPKYEWPAPGGAPPTLDEHSAAKHAVIRKYVARYIDVLTANLRQDHLTLSLVDGFAGGGRYLYRNQIVPGSPLILLEEVDKARVRLSEARRKPFTLDARFFFVERERAGVEYLDWVLGSTEWARGRGDLFHVLNSEFETALPGVVEAIKSRGRAHRAIFLLDQYGYSDVKLSAIRHVLSELPNAEVIMTFNVDWLITFLCEDERFLKGVAPVEISVDQVRRMLDLKGPSGGRWAIQHLLYRHIVERTGARFYTPFFVRSTASNRSYWLVHMSGHQKARDEMAQLHWDNSNVFVHQGGAGLKMLGFQPERVFDQAALDFDFGDLAETRSRKALTEELPPLIFEAAFRSDKPASLETLFGRVCNDTPATTKIISKVLVDLRAEKEVEIVTADGRPRPRTNSVDWTDLILPPKQRSFFSSVWPAPPPP